MALPETPAKRSINVFKPTFAYEEWEAVGKLMIIDWPGKGQKVTEFEAAWATHIGERPESVVSVNSCTEGLFTAVQLLGIGPGDEVIIPTIHFVGAAQAVLSVGARPVFCDVDSRTLNVTIGDILSKASGHTKAIIVNHYGGVPCDIEAIKSWCIRFGIYLIEDAACAPASTFNGQAVGTFGDIGVWSFDAMKIISTGDGGMMYIRDEVPGRYRELADKARKQLYLGTSEGSGLSSDNPRWWEFEVEIEGARRSIMNDMAAGVGLEQLKKLEGFIDRRLEIWATYHKALGGLVKLPNIGDLLNGNFPSAYFYWIQTPRRDELAYHLRANDCYTTFRYWPLHLAYKTGDSLPNAEKAARETLLLPLHQGLTDSDVNLVCEKVREFYA